ncbi:Scr1 family TA system antitoxin-like transcriptional regulator [Streptomyces cavourensis]
MPSASATLVNEAVLYRAVGGGTRDAGAVGALGGDVSHPSVTLQVVPFKAGAHAGMNGAFTLLRLPDAQPIVYLENLDGASVTRRPGNVAAYEEAFTDLQILAVGKQESLSMISKAIKEH